MRRIITLTALALGLTGGVAAADRDRHQSSSVRDHRTSGGHVDRGHVDRGYVRPSYNNQRFNNNQRFDRGGSRVVVNRNVVRRPIYANRDGRFSFGGGYQRPLYRPSINYHYRTYAQRPALIVENYDAVPGYVWVAGDWSWNGYEWLWTSGHYEADVSYDTSYDDGGYYGYPSGY
jgi:hypothetical protein